MWFVSYRGGFPPDNVAQIPPKPLSIQRNDAKGSATYRGVAFLTLFTRQMLPSLCRHIMWQKKADCLSGGANAEAKGSAR